MAYSRRMRFHRFGGPEVIQSDTVEPSGPDAGQILVAVRAASVNPVDFKVRSGKYPAVKNDRLPYTPGRDVSGTILACGAQANQFKPGDDVFGIVNIYGGGYAEQVVLDEDAVALKPARLDHLDAAAIPLAGQTAWQGLFRHGGLQPGQSVLIHGGSGGVGHFAIQFAKARGARVLTTVSTDNVEFARSLGADIVIDYKTQRFEDFAANLDLIFDLIDGETRERSWPLLKAEGILVTTLTAPSQETARKHNVRATRYTVQADGRELAEIATLVRDGVVRPHLQQSFALEAAAAAMAAVEHWHTVGKVVLAVR